MRRIKAPTDAGVTGCYVDRLVRMPSLANPGPEANPPVQPRILVVDDDDYVAVALQGALRSLKADIVQAGTAAEGLALARKHVPDLAIIDIGLPDADGYELTRALRAEASLAGLRILIITGHLPDEAAARIAGADLILGKPFRFTEFLEAASHQLRARPLAS